MNSLMQRVFNCVSSKSEFNSMLFSTEVIYGNLHNYFGSTSSILALCKILIISNLSTEVKVKQ